MPVTCAFKILKIENKQKKKETKGRSDSANFYCCIAATVSLVGCILEMWFWRLVPEMLFLKGLYRSVKVLEQGLPVLLFTEFF